MRTLSLALVLALAACGGSSSDTRRICQATADCGVIPESAVDQCTADLDEALAGGGDRAAAECADCAEAHTCGEIGDGACDATCEPVFAGAGSGVDDAILLHALTSGEANSVCEWYLEELGGPHTEQCGEFSVTIEMAGCVSALAAIPTSCAVTVGTYEACIEAAGGTACALVTAPECAPLLDASCGSS